MRLYQAWADGGAGLLISGNVMVDSRAMTGPGGWSWKTTRNWRVPPLGAHRAFRRRAVLVADQPSRPADAGQSRPAGLGALGGAAGTGRDVQALRYAEGDGRGDDRRGDPAVRPQRRPGRAGRLQRGGDPCRPRLPAQPVPLAAEQPPQRRLGRLPGESRAPAAGDRPGGARRGCPWLRGGGEAEFRRFPARRLQRRRCPRGGTDARWPGHRPGRAVGRQLRGAGHAGRSARRADPGPRGLLRRVRPRHPRGGADAGNGHGRHPPAAGGRAGAGCRVDMVGIGTALAIEPNLPRDWRAGRTRRRSCGR